MTNDLATALDQMSDAELEQMERLYRVDVPETLPRFFKRARPDLDYPEHLFAPGVDKDGKQARALGEAISASIHAPQQGSFSTPPQFGKSIFLLAALGWYGSVKPRSESAYVSYGDEIINTQSDRCREMCRNAGLQPRGPKACITLNNGSKIRFASAGGTLEGNPITGIGVYDDPYKNRAIAESPIERDKIKAWFFSTFLGRTHPSTSIFLIGHRWTADDLHMHADAAGFPWTNYPALLPDGRSLWEKFKSREWLEAKRATIPPITWLSEYQGYPMPRGGRLFEGVNWYTREELPARHLLKVAIGIDLAYTEKTASDWSIAVVLGEYNAQWYVLEVMRRQVKADVFTAELITLAHRYPGARIRWHASTTEHGSADIIRKFGKIDIQAVLAKGKPYDRAQLSGVAWSRGAILVPALDEKHGFPEHAASVSEFVRILTTFSGGEGAEDDDVVALASAFEQLPARPLTTAAKYGSPEWVMEQQEKARQLAIKQVQEQQRMTQRMQRGGMRR